MVENPRGHQVGRMGKAVVMMMMIISMYMETTQVWSGSRDLVPKLGSPVATAAAYPLIRLRKYPARPKKLKRFSKSGG